MPEVMNDIRIRCPKCASEDVTPKQVEVNRADPPANIVVNETQVIIDAAEAGGAHKVSVEVHCNACSAGSFWINTIMTEGEIWLKLVGDPDDDEQGPQPPVEPVPETQTRRR